MEGHEVTHDSDRRGKQDTSEQEEAKEMRGERACASHPAPRGRGRKPKHDRIRESWFALIRGLGFKETELGCVLISAR